MRELVALHFGLEGEISRLVDAIAQVGASQAITARIRKAEEERRRLQAEKPTPPALVRSLPTVAARYRRMLMDLPSTMKQDPDRGRAALAEVLGRVRLMSEDEEVYAEIENGPDGLLLAAGAEILGLVAGARRRALPHFVIATSSMVVAIADC